MARITVKEAETTMLHFLPGVLVVHKDGTIIHVEKDGKEDTFSGMCLISKGAHFDELAISHCWCKEGFTKFKGTITLTQT